MLILVPSRFELDFLAPGLLARTAEGAAVEEWGDLLDTAGRPVRVACCGVGLAESGARAGVLLAREPRGCRVALAGIAGTLQPGALPVGGVLVASGIEVDGIGVGEGEGFMPIPAATGPLADEGPSGPFAIEAPDLPGTLRGGIVSVASASADAKEASRRRERFASCLAEDMEAFAVAVAAASVGARLSVLRGVSNVAGDRNHPGWRVVEALASLREALGIWCSRPA